MQVKKLRGRKALKCKYYQKGSKDPPPARLPMEKSSDGPEFSLRGETQTCSKIYHNLKNRVGI